VASALVGPLRQKLLEGKLADLNQYLRRSLRRSITAALFLRPFRFERRNPGAFDIYAGRRRQNQAGPEGAGSGRPRGCSTLCSRRDMGAQMLAKARQKNLRCVPAPARQIDPAKLETSLNSKEDVLQRGRTRDQAIDHAERPSQKKVSPAPAAVASPGCPGIDAMSGLSSSFMALRSCRDFFHVDAAFFDPTDLTRTYPALFLTPLRPPHYCAPPSSSSRACPRFCTEESSMIERARGGFLLTRGGYG